MRKLPDRFVQNGKRKEVRCPHARRSAIGLRADQNRSAVSLLRGRVGVHQAHEALQVDIPAAEDHTDVLAVRANQLLELWVQHSRPALHGSAGQWQRATTTGIETIPACVIPSQASPQKEIVHNNHSQPSARRRFNDKLHPFVNHPHGRHLESQLSASIYFGKQ